jgi:hypothetical protein
MTAPLKYAPIDIVKEEKTELLAAIVLMGFVAAVFWCYWNGYYGGLPYPYNTFLFLPSARFGDFFDTLRRVKDLNPYLGGDVSIYYPFLNWAGFIFTLISDQRLSYILYCCLELATLGLVAAYFLHSKNRVHSILIIGIIAFLNYPLLILVDRGNFEGLVFVFVLLFIYFLVREEYLISAGFIAAAVASKLFPAVFMLLFLSQRRYKEFAAAVLFSAVLTAVSLLGFRGGAMNNAGYLLSGKNMEVPSVAQFLDNNNIVQRGVSLFTTLKVLLLQTGEAGSVNIPALLPGYIVLGIIAFICLGIYIVFVEQELWKKATLLTIAMLVLPQYSADYRLIYLLIPVFLFVNVREPGWRDILYTVLFGLLLIPKPYYFFTNVISDAGTSDISLAVILNPLIMLILCVMIVANRRPVRAPVSRSTDLYVKA